MTTGEIVANGIAALSLVVAIIALWRTNQAADREREAIIIIRNVWMGTPALCVKVVPPYNIWPPQTINVNPMPANPESQFAIDGTPLVADGLELRVVRPSDDSADDANSERPGNYVYRVLLEVKNVGRWAATGVKLNYSVGATYAEDFTAATYDREFPEQSIDFPVLEASRSCYVEIRNLIGLPAWIDFVSASASARQPARLEPPERVLFQPRGYQ